MELQSLHDKAEQKREQAKKVESYKTIKFTVDRDMIGLLIGPFEGFLPTRHPEQVLKGYTYGKCVRTFDRTHILF